MVEELAPLISHYGLIIIFFGMMIEGTTMIIATGVVCYMGMIPITQAIPVAIIGAIVGDWFWYFVGYKYARILIAKFPSLLNKIEHLKVKVEAKGNILAFSGRFIYGGALLFPLALGFYKYHFKKFALFEVIGTSLWATVGAFTGFILGKSAQYIFGEIKRVEHLLLIIVVISALVWFLRKRYLNNKD